MSSLKKLLIAAVGLVSLGLLAALAPLVSRGQVGPIIFPERGTFYLTRTTHNGSQARSACATGYHMASLWEIFDPSNHKYDHVLGLSGPDTGAGPPTYDGHIGDSLGWIRTGSLAQVESGRPGRVHCGGWTRSDAVLNGTAVGLIGSDWTTPGTAISPWHAMQVPCNSYVAVWCVADRDPGR
ncbi:MAG TPA: hypothetical protein VFB63_02475 [Bryobacteraceae bacterium]|jgi:hypothetical protein|nr:hypothetical protein [Bryobacteraceae bacterium]